MTGVDPAVDELERLAREVLPLLEQAEDHAGLAYVWFVLGVGVANARARYEDWAYAAEQELRHARLAGRRTISHFSIADPLVFGPRPADDALRTIDGLLPENPHPFPLLCRAWLLTMLGRFDEADQIAHAAGARLLDVTGDDAGDAVLGHIAATAGRHEDAAAHLRRYCDKAEASGLGGFLSAFAPTLGRSLCMLGRYDEAEPLGRLGRELGEELDPASQRSGDRCRRSSTPIVATFRGRGTRPRSGAVSDRSDGLNMQGDALCDLAGVLEAAGRNDEAAEAFIQALDRYDRKRNVAQAVTVRDRLAALRG